MYPQEALDDNNAAVLFSGFDQSDRGHRVLESSSIAEIAISPYSVFDSTGRIEVKADESNMPAFATDISEGAFHDDFPQNC